MNTPWTGSHHCLSHVHCAACRNDAAFRTSLLRAGAVQTDDFRCPEGCRIGQTENLPQPFRRGLGDVIEVFAKPIAKALKLPCLDDQDRLKPESPCAKRRDALNAAGRKLGL